MERRIEARMSVFSKVTLRIGEDRTDVLLLDISRTGARLLMPQGQVLMRGQSVALKMGVLPALIGHVVRCEGRVAGIVLTNKLHPSLVESIRQFCRTGDFGDYARVS